MEIIMGYSISVKFETEKEREIMRSFLLENKELIEKMKDPYDISPVEINDENNLPYAPKEQNLLGFHSSVTYRYIWRISTWMAEKSSVKSNQGKSYIYYDDEKIFISKDPQSQDILIDESGIFIKRKVDKKAPFFYKVLFFITKQLDKKQDELHKKILTQIEKKWMEYNSHPFISRSIKKKP